MCPPPPCLPCVCRGDQFYVGMMGIEVFDALGHLVHIDDPIKQVRPRALQNGSASFVREPGYGFTLQAVLL